MAGVTTLSRLLFVRLAPAVAWLLLLAAVATLVRGETAADDPNAVLRRFLGAWQTEAHLHKAGRPASDVVTRGNANCEQTLGNRYFEFRTATVPAGESDLQIMTYDPASRLYRQWVFSSDGYSHEAEGRWDATTSTLEWRGKTGETEFVIHDHWVSRDRLEWTLRRTKVDGTLVQTITGTVSRAGSGHQP